MHVVAAAGTGCRCSFPVRHSSVPRPAHSPAQLSSGTGSSAAPRRCVTQQRRPFGAGRCTQQRRASSSPSSGARLLASAASLLLVIGGGAWAGALAAVARHALKRLPARALPARLPRLAAGRLLLARLGALLVGRRCSSGGGDEAIAGGNLGLGLGTSGAAGREGGGGSR